MKKLKLNLILFATVVIGFILGFLVSGMWTRHEMNELMRWGTKEGFKEIVLEAIQPTPAQQNEVNRIVEKYAVLNDEHHSRWKKEHGELMHALTAELSAVLTPEQMEEWAKQGEHKKNK